MVTEVGSEYWLHEEEIRTRDDVPGWLAGWGNVVLTSSGRGALSLLIDVAAAACAAKVVLMPAYTCDSVIAPFAGQGFECLFYNVDDRLEPLIADIEALGKKEIGIFLHMGYYGALTQSGLRDAIDRLRRRGTLIVEDVTHTLFSRRPREESNDFVVCSLRKWTGIPSGGFLASSSRAIECRMPEHAGFYRVRQEALRLKGEYIRSGADGLKDAYLAKFDEGERLLMRDSAAYRIDGESRSLLHRLDVASLRDRRKENSAYLLRGLRDVRGLTPVFRSYEEGDCPFFVPVYIPDRRGEWRQRLIAERIYCPVHWPVPDALDRRLHAPTISVMDRILSIPTDQRYGIADMDRVVRTLIRISEEMLP